MATVTTTNKTLHIVLTREWFDKILDGTKLEEYREIKPFWIKRLAKEFGLSSTGTIFTPADYTQVVFQHGYQKNARRIVVEIKEIALDVPKLEYSSQEWVKKDKCFVIRLGEILPVARHNTIYRLSAKTLGGL